MLPHCSRKLLFQHHFALLPQPLTADEKSRISARRWIRHYLFLRSCTDIPQHSAGLPTVLFRAGKKFNNWKKKKSPYPKGKENPKLCSKKHESRIPLETVWLPSNATLPYAEWAMGGWIRNPCLGFILFVPASSANSRNWINKCIKVYINSVWVVM